MATFAGRTSPTALAALAPSITNLAAAQRAKSQAAAGLMNTLGVQFEKQKEQTAKREKNEAALEIAKGLIADPAFRRQMPGVTDAAGLVKAAGAENVLDFGIKTQQADRLAQQSAAQIDLTRKQIEQYDIDAKQREAEEASSKALTTLVGSMYGEGFTQEDLMTGLQGLSSGDAVRALNIYNERNPQDPLREIVVGGKTYIYSSKTGNAMLADDGSKLSKEVQSQIASVEKMDLPPERKQEMIQRILEYAATPRDIDGYPIEGFGGQPAAAAAGPFVPTEAEQALYSRMPDFFTEDNMVDSEKLEAELAKMDFLTPEEADRMRQYAAQESIARRRRAYLEPAEEEEKAEKSGGYLTRDPFSATIPESSPVGRGGGGRQAPDIASEMMIGGATRYGLPSISDPRLPASKADEIGRGIRQPTRMVGFPPIPDPRLPASKADEVGRGIRQPTRMVGQGGPGVPMVRPSARVPAAVTGQPGPGIGGGMEATGQGRVAAAQQIGERVRLSEGPLAKGVMEVLGPQIKAVGERIDETLRANRTLKEEQATFKRAKELARQEILKTYKGKDRGQILKELEKARLNRIKQMPKTSAQTKAQQKMHEVLMYMLNMEEAPLTSYGDPRMQSQPLLPVE